MNIVPVNLYSQQSNCASNGVVSALLPFVSCVGTDVFTRIDGRSRQCEGVP